MCVSLPGRMPAHPQLEVLWPIVQPVAVLVVNVLVRCKRSAETLFHDKSVFEPGSTVHPHHAIALSIDSAYPIFRPLSKERVAMNFPGSVVFDAVATG